MILFEYDRLFHQELVIDHLADEVKQKEWKKIYKENSSLYKLEDVLL